MGVLADRIEAFILKKMLEEQEGITLRRNELAALLDCAPSQISYVLSTRFSNDRGFIVESRRGLGGSITITRIVNEGDVLQSEDHESLTIADFDRVLFEHMKRGLISKREAALLHESFYVILQEIDPPRSSQVVQNLYSRILRLLEEEEQ